MSNKTEITSKSPPSSASPGSIQSSVKMSPKDIIAYLQYGDIIEIHAENNKKIHEQSFLVDYLDESKIRLVQTNTFDTYLFHINDSGELVDSSIETISLLTRAKDQGFARQKGLTPDKWVDIYFVGVPKPITGKITALEEDQIEVTMYPSKEPIYIDFAYRGIPEDLFIERFVLRTRVPKEWEKMTKTTQEIGVEEETEEDVTSPTEISSYSQASIDYTPDNEAIISLPEDVLYDKSYREILTKEYQDANEIIYGPDGEVEELYEEQYERVFSLEVQLESMLNEFLSTIPTAKRNERVMSNIQFLLERYRELHGGFSNIDEETGEIRGVKKHGPRHKPLKNALNDPKAPPKWLLPVTQTVRNAYLDEMPDNLEEYETYPDSKFVGLINEQTDEMPEKEILKDHKSLPTANVNPYQWTITNISPYMTNIQSPKLNIYRPRPILTHFSVGDDNWESVLDNQNSNRDFAATSMHLKNVKEPSPENLHESSYISQKYNTGFSFLELKEGFRRIYVQNKNYTPADEIYIQSWIMMPFDVAKFSRINLPMLNIAKRTCYSQHYWMKQPTIRGFKDSYVLEDLTKNIFSTKKGEERSSGTFLNGIQHYVLDRSIIKNEEEIEKKTQPFTDLYDQYIDAITPNTFDLIELVQPQLSWYQGMSLKDHMDLLEPFLVYPEDLTYTHLNRIRYYMKKQIQSYLKEFHNRKDFMNSDIAKYRRWNQELGNFMAYKDNFIKNIFENNKIYELFRSYKIPALGWNETEYIPLPLSNSEILQHMNHRDYFALFMLLLKTIMMSNVVPDEFLNMAQKDLKGFEVLTSTKSGCRRHILAKYYTSLTDLQKDNYQEDLYYDPDLDDTPYSLFDSYKKDMPEKWTDMDDPNMTEFLDLLIQNLIQKHKIAKEDARELAIRLVTKKRLVRDGEYAILDLSGDFESSNTDDRHVYYKRKGNIWVKDTTANEDAFMDLPSLINDAFKRRKNSLNQATMCNTSPDCIKNSNTQLCESTNDAENRIHYIRRQFAQEELGKRIEISMQERIKQLEQEIEHSTHRLFSLERWKYSQQYKWNNLAYHLGKLDLSKEGDLDESSVPKSPYTQIRDDILGQPDFAKRQHDIVRFYHNFLRSPMIEQLDEDPHWLYCVESNSKLLPKFLYDLALEYVTKGESGYRILLEKIKQNQEISDDGHAIVDKNSGYVISYIEWENEELYDERGFKIKTGDVLEPEMVDEEDEITDESKNVNILESEDMQMVKNIFTTFCRILEITKKEYDRGLYEFVIRVSLEYIEQNLMTPLDFQIQNEAVIKKRGWDEEKIKKEYKSYYHQYLVVVVTSIFLIGIQTSQPPIKTKKSIPGCVKSFLGYPMSETTEDLSGIQYMSCILNMIKSSYSPWSAIKSVKREIIQSVLLDQITEILEKRADINELYVKVREYRDLHPEEFEIPKDHQMQRWTNLLPPSVRKINIVEKLPRDRMITSVASTPKDADLVQSQIILYGYGVVEAINKIVDKKDILLKTQMGIPYVQNVCCNEKTDTSQTPLQYFNKESNQIGIFLENLKHYEILINQYRNMSKSTMKVFVDDTAISRRDVQQGNIEELIYSAFIHYGNFDRPDVDIPEYLIPVCSSKPDQSHYRRNGSLFEKIQDLKDSGRKYHIDDFIELMRLVNKQNKVHADIRIVKPTAIQLLIDFLGKNTTDTESPEIPKISYIENIRKTMLDILVKYDPQIALMENPKEEGEYHILLNELKDILIPANQEMFNKIMNFFVDYGNINSRSTTYTKLKQTFEKIAEWTESPESSQNKEEFYEMTQFLKNNITFMTKMIPEMIKNNMNFTNTEKLDIPKHWDFAEKHNRRIQEMISKYYSFFSPFFSEIDEEYQEIPKVSSANSNKELKEILKTISGNLSDLNMFSQMIPVTLPIKRDQDVWFRFMDRDTIKFLFTYLWYSVFDHYIYLTEHDVNLQSKFSTKTVRKGQIKATKNMLEESKLKQKIAELLLAFVKVVQEDKDRIDLSYDEIMKKIYRDRDVEKKSIMSRFEQVSTSDLKYVNMEKRFKIGRWLMEDVHKYKKTRYTEEITELLQNSLQEEGEIPPIQQDYDELGSDIGDEDEWERLGGYEEDTDLFDPDKEYASDDEMMDFDESDRF